MLLLALMAPWAAMAQTRVTQTFDFEDGTIPSTWTNDANYPWVVVSESQGSGHSGTYCIKSGNTGVSSSSSTISATFNFNDDGTISFLGGCFGEGSSTAWDKCIFSIDGEQQFSYGARGKGWFVGNTFPVKAGMHIFKWEYTKDSSVDAEGDAFYVDNIYFLQEGKDDDLITGVETIDHSPMNIEHSWFDLSGRKFNSKPAAPGLYIMNGKKVMVK